MVAIACRYGSARPERAKARCREKMAGRQRLVWTWFDNSEPRYQDRNYATDLVASLKGLGCGSGRSQVCVSGQALGPVCVPPTMAAGVTDKLWSVADIVLGGGRMGSRDALIKQALWLEWITVGWMLIEAAVAIGSGLAAHRPGRWDGRWPSSEFYCRSYWCSPSQHWRNICAEASGKNSGVAADSTTSGRQRRFRDSRSAECPVSGTDPHLPMSVWGSWLCENPSAVQSTARLIRKNCRTRMNDSSKA
jgi:hypothetical protein